MAIKTISEKPTLADTIRFVLETPDADGKFIQNPYKVDSVTIFFIERDFNTVNLYQYDVVENDTAYSFYYKEAVPVKKFGTDDCPAWLRNAHKDPTDPCPIDQGAESGNTFVLNIPEDEEGNPQYGVFELFWEPKEQREGQYFICWTWTPNPAGESITSHQYFEIFGTLKLNNLPQHRTPPDKYQTLLTRYMPSMFENRMSNDDVAPRLLREFNNAVGDGFTVLEDFTVQMIDMMDANVTAEAFLPLLGNYFNLVLKSNDPTLWRRQIKRAMPLFKRNGTIVGLKEAFANAGMKLLKLTKLWQIISKYTWTESINVGKNENEWILTRNPILPIDTANFEIYLRPAGEKVNGIWNTDFIQLTPDYVEFEAEFNYTRMRWIGDTLSVDPIGLEPGDTIKVTYQIHPVPNSEQQDIENYIRYLPLNDQRDDRDQKYPLKNWNIHVIAEDDPIFDLVIPERHPFTPPVVFGQVRTEFPFSENVYNMDEWNGSLRDSMDPCDIDKNFLDCCTDCLGSRFNAAIEVESLADARLIEVAEIFEEYKPFHALLQTLSISGLIEDFINCNVEEIEALLTFDKQEYMLCGAQSIFSRYMEHARGEANNDWYDIHRDALNDLVLMTPVTPPVGKASNAEIVLCAPYVNFIDANINNYNYTNNPAAYTPGSNNNVLQILAPSANAGTYVLSGIIDKHVARIDQTPGHAISEPLDGNEFTFRVSNVIYSNPNNVIHPDNLHYFSDATKDFTKLEIKTQWDVDHDTNYHGIPWSIKIGANVYDILQVMPDGSLLLEGGTVGNKIIYDLLDADGNKVCLEPDCVNTGTLGTVRIKFRGRVEITDSQISDVRLLFKIGDYVVIGNDQYRINGFVENELNQVYIDGYQDAEAATSLDVYRRVVDDAAGFVGYRGLTLTTNTGDYEASLGILNGASAPYYPFTDFNERGSGRTDVSGEPTDTDDGKVKENFIIRLEIGTSPDVLVYYFTIDDIKGDGSSTIFKLGGEPQNWPTTGIDTKFSIYKAVKKPFTVHTQTYPKGPGYDFTTPADGGPPTTGVGRMGKDIISYEVEYLPATLRAAMLNSGKDQMVEVINQQEGISFQVEYADGKKEEGTI